MTLKKICAVFMLGGLVGLATVLGIKIYQGSSLFSSSQDVVKGVNIPYSRVLSDDEKKALLVPQNTASSAEKEAHFELASRLSVETDTLNISSCLGEPLVFTVVQGSKFTARNDDVVDHTIQLSEKLQFVVPAGKMIDIPVDFGFGAGVYGYGCDNSITAAGVFLVR